MKIFKTFFIISFLTFILVEFTGFFLIKTKLLNIGLPSWVTFYADEDTSFWHPSNVTFRLQKKNCWLSTVSYNNFGMRDTEDLTDDKRKKRIAILGTSMQESIQLSDGFDFGGVLKKKMDNYEVFNFSLRGSGFYDRIDVYNKYISKQNFDILLLFINDGDFFYNDFNYQRGRSPNIPQFKVVNNEVIKIDRDEKFFIKYNTLPNRTKRYLSKYLKKLSTYQIYLSVNDYLRSVKINEEIVANKAHEETKYSKNFEDKKKIYKHIKDKFVKSLNKDTELFVVYNLMDGHFKDEIDLNNQELFTLKKVRPFLKKVWADEGFYDPLVDARNFLINKKKNEYPFLSIGDCDGHYSTLGVEFYSDYLKKIITKN